MYDLEITSESLASAVKGWGLAIHKDNVNDSPAAVYAVDANKKYRYENYPAEVIDTQETSTTPAVTMYDTEIFIAANNYLYKFETNFQNSNNPLQGNLLTVFKSLSI